MTQPDLTLDEAVPPRRNKALRLLLWVLMTLCGLTIAAILLSDPRVTSKLQPAVEDTQPATETAGAAETADTGSFFGWGSSEPEQKPVEKPAVRAMPTNRIPVRRAGN